MTTTVEIRQGQRNSRQFPPAPEAARSKFVLTYLGLLCLSLVLLFGPIGCAHVSRTPLPDEVKAQLGPVAVIAARFAPTTDLQTPASGGVGGAGRGMAAGAATGTYIGAGLASACAG